MAKEALPFERDTQNQKLSGTLEVRQESYELWLRALALIDSELCMFNIEWTACSETSKVGRGEMDKSLREISPYSDPTESSEDEMHSPLLLYSQSTPRQRSLDCHTLSQLFAMGHLQERRRLPRHPTRQPHQPRKSLRKRIRVISSPYSQQIKDKDTLWIRWS